MSDGWTHWAEIVPGEFERAQIGMDEDHVLMLVIGLYICVDCARELRGDVVE